MSTIKFITAKNVFLLSMAICSNAVYANDAVSIGAASNVVNDVLTPTAAGEKQVVTNDTLFFKQQIITKENSTLTVAFRDSSTFAIAPDSTVVLDEFVFNPNENIAEKSINMLKGSFRYISGFPVKEATTKIVTPYGIAGIRGCAVQGHINPKTGFTLNVVNGVVVFETLDGKTLTINEGESFFIPVTGNIKPAPVLSLAKLMQYWAIIFAKTNFVLTPAQILANAKANNTPATKQKETTTLGQKMTIKAPSLQATKIKGNPQTVINKHIKDLQNKNNAQVDSAVRNTVATALASGMSADKILQIATNAITGAKAQYRVYVAATIINTLQELKFSATNELAPKIQQMLSPAQQQELPLLVPNVNFQAVAPVTKSDTANQDILKQASDKSLTPQAVAELAKNNPDLAIDIAIAAIAANPSSAASIAALIAEVSPSNTVALVNAVVNTLFKNLGEENNIDQIRTNIVDAMDNGKLTREQSDVLYALLHDAESAERKGWMGDETLDSPRQFDNPNTTDNSAQQLENFKAAIQQGIVSLPIIKPLTPASPN